MTCDHCTTPTAEGIRLCIDCTIRLERILDEAPDLLHEAQTTIARMDRTTDSGPSTATTARREAVNVEALDRSRELIHLLTSWARYTLDECARTGAPVHPGLTVSQLLRHNTNTIRHATWADDCLTELARAHRRLHAAIDTPPDWRTYGPCHIPGCNGLIRGTPGDTIARCRTCREPYDATELTRNALLNAWDNPAPLKRIVSAMELAGFPVPRTTMRRWAAARKITPVGHDNRGRPLYTMTQAWEVRTSALDDTPTGP